MADDDFDIAGLAAYLHMMPAQIARLADRGKLPARRVGGQWRFSPPEITHWLEQRIGVSDDDELAAMESTLERADQSGAGDVDLAAMLPVEAVAVPLTARTRTSVIAALCDLAAVTGSLWDADKMAKAVVATPEANEGIGAPEGEALLLARDPRAFADHVLALLADSRRRRELGSSGRAFVEAKWTWEGPFLELEAAFLAAS